MYRSRKMGGRTRVTREPRLAATSPSDRPRAMPRRVRVRAGNAILLDVLPHDMLLAIVKQVDSARSLLNTAVTCSMLHQIVQGADDAWRRAALARFPRLADLLGVLMSTDFRAIYKAQLAAEYSDASAEVEASCSWEDISFTFELYQWYPTNSYRARDPGRAHAWRDSHLLTCTRTLSYDAENDELGAFLWDPCEDNEASSSSSLVRRMPAGVDGYWGERDYDGVHRVPCAHLIVYATRKGFHTIKIYEGKPDDDDSENVFYAYRHAPCIEGQQAICRTISPWCRTLLGKMMVRFFAEAPDDVDDHRELNEQEALSFMLSLPWSKA